MIVVDIPIIRTVYNPETGESLDIPSRNSIEVQVFDGVLHFVKGGQKGSEIEKLNDTQLKALTNISEATA